MVDYMYLKDPISPTLRREHEQPSRAKSRWIRSSVKYSRIIKLIGLVWVDLRFSPVSHGPSLVNGVFFLVRYTITVHRQ